MSNREQLKVIVIGILIAAVWGYFSDLRHGQVGAFIGRLVFTPVVALLAVRIFARRKFKKEATSEQDTHSE